MKTWKLLAALPLLLTGLLAAIPAGIEETMPERLFPQLDGILKGAVQQSPRMLNRALDLERAESSRIQARSNLLPTVSASYSYYKSKDKQEYLYPNPGSNSSNSYELTKTPYNLTVSQPVFFWGERRNNDLIGEIQQNIAKGQYREGYRLLAQELRSSYLRLIVQKTMVKRARFYLDYVNTQLKQQEERLAKKVISEVEISIARLSAEQGQIALERTEFDFQNALGSFARLAGTGVMTEEAIPDFIPPAAYASGGFEQVLAGFLAQKDPPSTEALTLRQQLKIENLNYANAKTRLKPKVSASFGLTQDEQHNLYGQNVNYSVNSIYGGVSVNWAIFDGFASSAAVRNALAYRRQLENDYRQLTERLAQDAQTLVKQINFSARNMAIYDRLLLSSEGYLKTVQGDYKRGLKSEADVGQTQLGVFDAQINAGNARTDFLVRTGDFLGTVVEDPILTNLAEK